MTATLLLGVGSGLAGPVRGTYLADILSGNELSNGGGVYRGVGDAGATLALRSRPYSWAGSRIEAALEVTFGCRYGRFSLQSACLLGLFRVNDHEAQSSPKYFQAGCNEQNAACSGN